MAQSEVREQEIERLKRLTTEQAREMALQCEMMHRLQNAHDRCVCVCVCVCERERERERARERERTRERTRERERERERESERYRKRERERERGVMHGLKNAHGRCVCERERERESVCV